MISLETYAGLSVVSTLAVIYHAICNTEQFFAATVYVSTTEICLAPLLNMGVTIMYIVWQLIITIFLGSLHDGEVERLNEQSWVEISEIFYSISTYRKEFSVMFFVMVTALLFVKSLHLLAQKRIENIEVTPNVPILSHIRTVSLLGILLTVDCLFLYNSVEYLVSTHQVSVSMFYSFEYMILATTTISTFAKYVFFVIDVLMEGQWGKKAVYTFYLELIRDLLQISLYLCFFLVILVNYRTPVHYISEFFDTFKNIKLRIANYIRYLKITSNIDDRFPDATFEELNASAEICIFCREEMTTAKKLSCGHFFHVNCLRSWFEGQHTCPICRALVIPNEGQTITTGSQAGAHCQGTNSANAASQEQSGDGAGNGNINNNQKLVQAAGAASTYQKSLVYPSPGSLTWSFGYAVHPMKSTPGTNINSAASSAENSSSNNRANFPFIQFQQTGFVSVRNPGTSPDLEDGWSNNLQMSVPQLEAQEKIIQHQIEVLQDQLQLLHQIEVRKELGINRGVKTVVLNSGGQTIGLEVKGKLVHDEFELCHKFIDSLPFK